MIPGVGPVYANRLKKLGIASKEDFLYHVPSRYENFSIISKIKDIQEGETVTIQGKVAEIRNIYTKSRKIIQKAQIEDETGTIEVTWFNQPFLIKSIHKGDNISLSGKIGLFSKKLTVQSPEYEILTGDNTTVHTGRLVPIYPETQGISSKWLRRQIYKILQFQRQNMFEYLPYSIIERYDLMGLNEAFEQVHFPKTLDNAERARLRLSFDELFLVQLAAVKRKNEWKENFTGNAFKIAKFKKIIQEFYKKLPFELTGAQKRAVSEIFADLARKKSMNRLLEGEVGSGKTVVATIAMYLARLNGYQSLFLAPTEILAKQHYKTISDLLRAFGIKVELVTGSIKPKNTKIDILVGTHAALSKKVNFNNLGLVVVDEQQRFGVEQRSLARQKGKNPHFLTMTATPIPRTVALTLYGDLDLSMLDEMPKGRKTVKTWLVPPEKREGAYEWIKSQISNLKSQIFIICPFIEESESLTTVKAATVEFEKLTESVFKNFRVGLLHGRLKAKEKDAALLKFRTGELDILVATPVVEVGIDIPNATIMMIEGAERFGLAQLHQLRGRVGRSDKDSYCLLFTNSDKVTRLKAMEKIFVGAELAELDLKLRGPGEIYGTRQHGTQLLKIASFSQSSLIEISRREAQNLFPKLVDFPLLQERIKKYTIQKVAPD